MYTRSMAETKSKTKAVKKAKDDLSNVLVFGYKGTRMRLKLDPKKDKQKQVDAEIRKLEKMSKKELKKRRT